MTSVVGTWRLGLALALFSATAPSSGHAPLVQLEAPLWGPAGLYALGDKTTNGLRDHSFVNGFTLRLRWSELETEPGVYDFSLVDAALLEVERHEQQMTLELFSNVPAEAVLATFGATFVDFRGTLNGVPWDETQLSTWEDFTANLASHFVPRLDGSSSRMFAHPNLETVNAPIAGLQDIRDFDNRLASHPDYTREKLTAATLRSVYAVYDRFPAKFTFVGLFPMSDADTTSPLDEALLETLLDEFVRGHDPPRLGFFQETLADVTPEICRQGKLLKRASEETFIMFQALTSWVNPHPLLRALHGRPRCCDLRGCVRRVGRLPRRRHPLSPVSA